MGFKRDVAFGFGEHFKTCGPVFYSILWSRLNLAVVRRPHECKETLKALSLGRSREINESFSAYVQN